MEMQDPFAGLIGMFEGHARRYIMMMSTTEIEVETPWKGDRNTCHEMNENARKRS